MGSLSPVHWLIVAVVVLLLFGPKALSTMGKGLGEGLRSFKKGLNEDPPEPPRDPQPLGDAEKPAPTRGA